MEKKALGKGLKALLPTYTDLENTNGSGEVFEVSINSIEPNPNQPRKDFDDDALYQLSQSIKDVGVIQPLIVKKEKGYYRIVAGERRWRAARMAGLKTLPVITKELSSLETMKISLIENLQREDLNPIDEALGYEYLIDEFQLTQDQISEAVRKSRSTVANSLRLLKLSKSIQELLRSKRLSPGHARALLSIEDERVRAKVAEEITASGLSVRQVEALVKDGSKLEKYYPEKKPATLEKLTKSLDERQIALERIENELKNLLGSSVRMVSYGKKGKIIINYHSDDDLNRILGSIGLNEVLGDEMGAY